jgi:hypothetical protein
MGRLAICPLSVFVERIAMSMPHFGGEVCKALLAHGLAPAGSGIIKPPPIAGSSDLATAKSITIWVPCYMCEPNYGTASQTRLDA